MFLLKWVRFLIFIIKTCLLIADFVVNSKLKGIMEINRSCTKVIYLTEKMVLMMDFISGIVCLECIQDFLGDSKYAYYVKRGKIL